MKRTQGRLRSAALAALLVFSSAGVGLWSGCAASLPRGERPATEGPPAREGAPPAAPLPGETARPAPLPPPAPSLPRSDIPGMRPVRVLLSGALKDISVEGEGIRAWSEAGSLVAEDGRQVTLTPRGNRVGWGREKVLDSPVDIAAASELRVAGRRIAGRVRVSAREGRLRAVAVVPLEEYVAAVVSREASPSFRPEALSALAVAVRTYVLAAMEKPRDPGHDVVAGVEDQVFEGMDGVDDHFRKAAEATRGEVLTFGGSLARAVYHSTCGGRTETAKDAWGAGVPYLRSVDCDDCLDSPVRKWEYRMTGAEGRRVARALGVRAEGALRLEIAGRSSTGRASRIRIASGGVSREAAAAAFRREAGYARVRSLSMEIVPVGNGWLFVGQGYGHGVGMCQWGANGMAKSGKGHREILARYYPGALVARGGP